MRIAVNGRWLLTKRPESLGRYTWEVLIHLMATHPEAQWHLVIDRCQATEHY
jgi:hypothetical protein